MLVMYNIKCNVNNKIVRKLRDRDQWEAAKS